MKKKIFFGAAMLFAYSLAFPQVLAKDPYEDGVAAYYAGNKKEAKKLLSSLQYNNDLKSRFADFLLLSMAVSDGNMAVAKELFPRALKNLPESNELALLEIFTEFVDANREYEFEAELMRLFYEKNKTLFEKSSLSMYRYAKALYETGDKKESEKVLMRLWEIFSDSPSADGCDALLFDGDLRKSVLPNLKASHLPISQARVSAFKGVSENFILPEGAGLGLVIWAFEKGKAEIETLEEAIENYPDSQFAWRAWHILGKRAFEDGHYDLANGFSTKALSLAPDDIVLRSPIYILQGDSLRFAKKYEEAQTSYKAVFMNDAAHGEKAAESLYKAGLASFEAENWKAAYIYFERVFLGYEGFEYWTSRAYYYGAKARLGIGDNLGARNVLTEYLKTAKQRDTKIFDSAMSLYYTIDIK